jgi:hypothetical protein
METDGSGQYRFQNVCPGRYTVIADYENVPHAHSHFSPMLIEFLYGTRVAEVKLTATHPRTELPVSLPPKPGVMHVRILNRETKQEVLKFSVQLKVPGQLESPELSFLFDTQVREHDVEVPPDKDVICHVTADGFQEWSESAGTGKVIHVGSGNEMTLEADLDPLK